MSDKKDLQDPRRYCSEENADEPLWGTADVVDVWLMLEYRPVWTAHALADSGLTQATRDWLAGALKALEAAGLRARPQFIRRPELDTPDTRLLVSVHDCLLEFAGPGYDFLQDLDLAAIVREPHRHRVLTEPHYFVCTNGQRDLCCARYGLPVYNQLREWVGDRVWQVTHLGGHRFAPNVLVLPGGLLYGRVASDGVVEFVQQVDDGALAFKHLRGRSCYPQHVQAAEAAAGLDHLRLLHVTGNDQEALVTFAGPDQSVSVRVGRSSEPLQVLKSCGDEQPSPVFPYRRL